ncbi:hypothetical protein N7535_003389 [Penicillium sp. DV-2018c]|nr:hypothetical protein N7535_003389 [Penicillium sp. DV-2018c]
MKTPAYEISSTNHILSTLATANWPTPISFSQSGGWPGASVSTHKVVGIIVGIIFGIIIGIIIGIIVSIIIGIIIGIIICIIIGIKSASA